MTAQPWTVVTVTYHSADTLRRCWRGPKPYEWLVVDNARPTTRRRSPRSWARG
ncbi:hypothetical protein V2I01_21355 [Micromonospora sp. BRA006-A]|nr:hypothetical protein [Micromonospora sp. BRA006-A]